MDNLYIGAVYEAGIVKYADASAMDQPTMILYHRPSKRAYRIDGEAVSGENAYQMRMLASETINVFPGVYDMEIYINYDDPDNRELIYHKKDEVNAMAVSEYIEQEEESSSGDAEESSSGDMEESSAS